MLQVATIELTEGVYIHQGFKNVIDRDLLPVKTTTNIDEAYWWSNLKTCKYESNYLANKLDMQSNYGWKIKVHKRIHEAIGAYRRGEGL